MTATYGYIMMVAIELSIEDINDPVSGDLTQLMLNIMLCLLWSIPVGIVSIVVHDG